MSSSLAQQLKGKSDDEIVKVLQRILLQGGEEATNYLKTIPPERADALRWKLVASLESIGRKKKSSKSGGEGSRSGNASEKRAMRGSSSSVSSSSPDESGDDDKASGSSNGNGGSRKSRSSSSSSSSSTKASSVVIGNRYQMGELLGKGGFARVFKALDLQTGQQLAVKEIQKDLLSKTELPKILNEGKVLAALTHPNIVQFHELIQDKKQIYFVMEYISGGSLYHIMKRFGVFPESLACIYVAQTLLALEYLHAQRVLHRDIKGANLLLDSNGRIKVADFGACTYAQLDKRLTVIGTPFWMAPEIIEMTSGGTAADIWSLGCTVIELLTGSPPYFTLGSMQALFRMVDDPHPPLPAGLGPACHDFLMQCFVKDFAKRPTATQLLCHEWIRSGIQGKDMAGVTQEQMQMTLRQHNQSKKVSIASMDWGTASGSSGILASEHSVLEKQAKMIRQQEEGQSEEALNARLAKKEKEKARLAKRLEDSKATLAALKKDILALTAEQSKLELERVK